MQLKLRYNLPILPIVIFITGGSPDISWRTAKSNWFGKEISHFSYVSFGLSKSDAAKYLKKKGILGTLLAAHMKGGKIKKPTLKVKCIQKIAKSKLNEAEEFIAVDFIETYIPLDNNEQKEYNTLLQHPTMKEAKMSELSWAEKIERKSKRQGKAEGKAEGVITILEKRGIPITEEEKQKILTCLHLKTIELWFDRALSVSSSTELFAPIST